MCRTSGTGPDGGRVGPVKAPLCSGIKAACIVWIGIHHSLRLFKFDSHTHENEMQRKSSKAQSLILPVANFSERQSKFRFIMPHPGPNRWRRTVEKLAGTKINMGYGVYSAIFCRRKISKSISHNFTALCNLKACIRCAWCEIIGRRLTFYSIFAGWQFKHFTCHLNPFSRRGVSANVDISAPVTYYNYFLF